MWKIQKFHVFGGNMRGGSKFWWGGLAKVSRRPWGEVQQLIQTDSKTVDFWVNSLVFKFTRISFLKDGKIQIHFSKSLLHPTYPYLGYKKIIQLENTRHEISHGRY